MQQHTAIFGGKLENPDARQTKILAGGVGAPSPSPDHGLRLPLRHPTRAFDVDPNYLPYL